MITIKFYYNKSDLKVVSKSLTEKFDISGTIKDKTSIIDPTLLIEGNLNDISECNYIYIPTFGRYYYIKDIVSVGNNLVEISCHVDVLMSFKTEIKSNTAIVRRNEKKFNLYLNDGVFKTYQNPIIQVKSFPNGFTTEQFVLSVAGGTGSN